MFRFATGEYNKVTVTRLKVMLPLFVLGILLSSCSGESFHLRGSTVLPVVYKKIYLQGTSATSAFGQTLQSKLREVGSELVSDPNQATAIVQLSNYQEGKRVAGYGPNREVREYLIFLRFDLSARSSAATSSESSVKSTSVNSTSVSSGSISSASISSGSVIKSTYRELIPSSKINLDKIQIYDSAFVLGKIEEERLIKDELRKNAARQVMLRLQYGNPKF